VSLANGKGAVYKGSMAFVYVALGVLGSWLVSQFLNQFFKKWFELRFWPRLADRWAERSRATTLKRIHKLEARLKEIESLPLLTEVEDALIRGFFALFALIAIVILFVILVDANFARYSQLPHGKVSVKEFRNWSANGLSALLLVVIWAFCQGIALHFASFRERRSKKYRKMIADSIEGLNARLRKPSSE
jgi:hypothetical protein